MLCFPNAKINIGLHITSKRKDGFHNIETIFYPVELCDALEFVVSDKKDPVLETSGIPIDGKLTDNLCIKAYSLLKEDFGLPGIDIHLHKIIPIGAGLGGGSSDASFMLKSLNDFFELDLSEEELIKRAKKIGSDCAFFIRNKPCIAYEKGDKLEEINILLNLYQILLVYPKIHISTKEAYANIKPKKPEKTLSELTEFPLYEWKNHIKNDFEEGIFQLYPEMEHIKNELYNMGAIYVSMSGSGSSIYGIFGQIPELPERFKDYYVWYGNL